MKDPCEECIVRVNCTAICFEKTNYKALLETAIKSYKVKYPNKYQYKAMIDYYHRLNNTNADEIVITRRAASLKLV